MAHRANKRPPGRIKSSIVARLNTRLFFRLLGIYFCMDLLLCLLVRFCYQRKTEKSGEGKPRLC